ncbi:MAG: metalloregulator ArsR/SmtB family transcription factor [Syntrophobacteraceae bacterium]|jgi:ArsR family transcriptional regulator
MREFIKVMKAVSDPSRVKVLKMLQHKSMCVCEMQTALNLAQPTVSKHLKILEDAGLVTCRKSGLWVNYYLADGGTTPYAASLLGNLKHWLDNDPEIIQLGETIPSIRREDVRKATTVSRTQLKETLGQRL